MMDIKKPIQKNKILLILILILIISFFVRVYGLQSENIWPDEGGTVFHAHKSVLHNIKWSLSVGYFPLYHVILSSWEKIFGLEEFSVRFLSLIFGILSVYIVFKIGTFMFNKKVGIYSAIIMALSPFNVSYSQEARVYTLLVLLSLSSIYFYLRFIESQKKKHMIYYILFTFLMLNTHAPAIFILVFQNIHYLLFVKKNFKKWIFIQFALFILFLPLLLITLSSISDFSEHIVIPKPNIVTLLKTFYIFSAGSTFEITALAIGSFISIGFFLLLFLVLLQMVKDVKNKKYLNLNKTIFLLLWLAVPILLLLMQSYVSHSVYFVRFIIVSSIALYILIALSITRFNNKTQMAIMTSIIILSLMMLYVDFETNNQGRWKDTTDYIKINKNENDAVVLHVSSAIYSFAYYFDPECFKSDDLTGCMSIQDVYGVYKKKVNASASAINNERVFLILYNAKYVDTEGIILKYYIQNYKLIEEKKYRHIQIFTFNKPAS